MLTVRVSEELLRRIDDWRRKQADGIPTRPEVARIALERLLAEDCDDDAAR